MKHPFPFISLITILLAASAYSQTTAAKINSFHNAVLFNQDSLATEIKVLASDAFEGRKPFTRGETKTINYLKRRFQAMCVEAGNGNSYFQDVPMVSVAAQAAPTMEVQSPKGSFELKGFDDYVLWTDRPDKPVITLDKAGLVFAGYGVVAPEYGWNDYAGLDVKGKVVLVLVNDPGFGVDTTLFKGDTMTYYGRWTYKFEEAARQGAKGCLIIHTTKAASYPFTVVQNNWNSAKLHLDNRAKGETLCDVVGWVTEATSKKLLEAAGVDTTVLLKAAQRGFKAVPLPLQLSTSVNVTATYKKSHNVIAKVTGSKYPNEYIIYTAHWDHLGIGKPDEKGDSIYNGALDNASGTAGLLELARAFKSLQPKPERTVVFLAVTSEEQGLWGSAYYAQHPVYPLAKTVADINTDVLNFIGRTKDLTVVGKGQNELEDYLAEAAQKQGRYIAFETHPESGGYFRSDHFNFAKAGVPALYAGGGTDVVGKGKAYGEQQRDNYSKLHYHRPSDEYDPATINLEGAEEDLKVLFEVGQRLAFSHTWPQWKAGSEFKAKREQSAALRQ